MKEWGTYDYMIFDNNLLLNENKKLKEEIEKLKKINRKIFEILDISEKNKEILEKIIKEEIEKN